MEGAVGTGEGLHSPLHQDGLPVLGELPEAHPQQAGLGGQLGLGGDGLGVVVGEEAALAGEVGDLGLAVAELPVGRVGEVGARHRVVGEGAGGGKGAVEAVAAAAHPIVAVAVEGHAQHQLVRRDAAVQIGRHAVADTALVVGGGAGRRIEWGVEVGVAVPGAVEVVGHEEDVVHRVGHGGGLDVAEVPAPGGAGDGELVVPAVQAALPVQLLPDGLKEEGEVLLVLGPVDGAGGAAGDGVLPVQVDAVQAVGGQELRAAPGEGLPPGGGGGHIGEVGGVVPPAHRQHELQVRMLFPQRPEGGEILSVLFGVIQDQGAGVRVDAGEGVVDVGEQADREVRRLVALVGRPAGIIAHNRMGGRGVCMGCLFAGGGNGPHRRPQQQEDGAEQDCPPQKMVRKSHGMLLFSRIDGSIVPKIGQ